MIVYLLGNSMDLRDAKKKYWEHRENAKKRGIQFLITFEQWTEVWEQSGKWEERGRGSTKYCMGRHGDTGPYEVNNVFIQTNASNLSYANKNNKHNLGNKHSEKSRLSMSATRTGVPSPKKLATCPHCNFTAASNNMKRWHFDKCKRKAA
jgi:hypothetical protein